MFTMTSNEWESSGSEWLGCGGGDNGRLIADEDLRPVFYELDELEKRLSESLCELAKMRSRNDLARLAHSIETDESMDDLRASLLDGSSGPVSLE